MKMHASTRIVVFRGEIIPYLLLYSAYGFIVFRRAIKSVLRAMCKNHIPIPGVIIGGGFDIKQEMPILRAKMEKPP
jgi:hypothetical protein